MWWGILHWFVVVSWLWVALGTYVIFMQYLTVLPSIHTPDSLPPIGCKLWSRDRLQASPGSSRNIVVPSAGKSGNESIHASCKYLHWYIHSCNQHCRSYVYNSLPVKVCSLTFWTLNIQVALLTEETSRLYNITLYLLYKIHWSSSQQ